MEDAHQILARSLKAHSRLGREDIAELSTLRCDVRQFEPGVDFIHQGDRPNVSVVVVAGMVGRYHLLADGRRQYLSFHMAGDLPDAQTLFIEEMDHGLSSIGPATIAFIPHAALIRSFSRRPVFGFAIWRATLLDAAIFREAITNIGARTMVARMAHLFCELFYRAREARLCNGDELDLPISRTQLGEALGMAIATVHRTLRHLEGSKAMEFRVGKLTVRNWRRLVEIGEFNPRYLHVKNQAALRTA
ncbi:MAG TPA: Crp/Fnr family transcriptional regulator [Pseudolabrys sp.]|nr:Crp/Fnr family transcriptional regulator [Pseudolabrys sp.]